MKIFLVFVISIFWILRPDPQIEDCNLRTIKQALPPITWFEQTIDGHDQSVWVTRFLHNKVGIAGSQFAKCYFNSMDPVVALKSLGTLGFIFWLYFVYFIFSTKSWPLIALFLTGPVLPVVLDKEPLIAIFYKLFTIAGTFFFFKKI